MYFYICYRIFIGMKQTKAKLKRRGTELYNKYFFNPKDTKLIPIKQISWHIFCTDLLT